MGRTPDRFPGEREDEGLQLVPDSVAPTSNGELRYVSGLGFRFFEEGVEKGLTATGLSELTHEVLDSLTHEIAETNYTKINRDGSNRLSSVIVWTDNTTTTKIRETLITRDGSNKISVVTEKQYDGAGALKTTLTTTYTRVSGRITSADVVRS